MTPTVPLTSEKKSDFPQTRRSTSSSERLPENASARAAIGLPGNSDQGCGEYLGEEDQQRYSLTQQYDDEHGPEVLEQESVHFSRGELGAAGKISTTGHSLVIPVDDDPGFPQPFHPARRMTAMSARVDCFRTTSTYTRYKTQYSAPHGRRHIARRQRVRGTNSQLGDCHRRPSTHPQRVRATTVLGLSLLLWRCFLRSSSWN